MEIQQLALVFISQNIVNKFLGFFLEMGRYHGKRKGYVTNEMHFVYLLHGATHSFVSA